MAEPPKLQRLEGRPKDDGSPIVCSVCTFVNPSDSIVCEVCSNHLEVTDAIMCRACTFRNTPPVLACAMCGVELADSEEMLSKFMESDADQRDSSTGSESELGDCELGILMQSIYDEEVAEEAVVAQRKQQELVSMRKTVTGKAWCLIDAVIELNMRLDSEFGRIQRGSEDLGTISVDDMIMFAEKLIELQSMFQAQGKPTRVTIAYHYTTEQSIEGIRQNGLMSGPEREANNIDEFQATGSYYGPGIYMANNPYAFQHFGDVGVIAAVLAGKTRRKRRYRRTSNDVDTIVGNKSGYRGQDPHFEDEIVLMQSAQCLPLIGYSTSIIEGPDHSELLTLGSKLIWRYHQHLQYLMDEILNDGDETIPEMGLSDASIVLPRVPRPSPAKVGPSSHQDDANSVATTVDLSSQSLVEELPATGRFNYAAPDALTNESDRSHGKPVAAKPLEQCPICFSGLTASVVELSVCGHCFHGHCLDGALEHQPKCPVCRAAVAEPQGKSPSGSMTMSVLDRRCNGFHDCGTIWIEYSLPDGIQKPYHPSPGARFEGTDRTAFLPNNSDGRKLLKRLVYAFQHGLTFAVGTSLTTGHQNTTVWASIHHKTSFYGGNFSFPDPNYFFNCNEELDGLGVPPAAECTF